jgi:hemerythrin-like metal-binding protein
MRLLAWNEGYATGVETIDAEHRAFMDSINRLMDEPGVSGGPNGSHLFFERLRFALERQFEKEERLMRELRYAGSEAHQQDHDRLRDQMHDLEEIFGEAEEIDIVELSMRLDSWFMRHFRTHDSALYGYTLPDTPGIAKRDRRGWKSSSPPHRQ